MENSRNGKRAKKPSSLEEWLEAFGHFKNEDEAGRYYKTLLDFPDWRPQALVYLLDGLDYGRGDLLPGNCGPAIRPQMYCRTTMVELLLDYLTFNPDAVDPNNLGVPAFEQDCIREGELFQRLLRSLRLLRVGYPLNAGHRQQMVCAFLERCTKYEVTDKPKFASIRDEFRSELYKALAEYEMYNLVPNSTLIQHAFTSNRRDPKTWGEWLSGLVSTSSNQEYIAYLGMALDYFTWRPQAVLFLLDIMDYEEDRQGWKQSNIPALPKKSERYTFDMLLAASSKLRAADLIVFDYIKSDPREGWALWVEDCEKEPGLLPRLLQSLYLHSHDEYMRDQTRYPRSVVKKFLKSCMEVSGHDDEGHKFADLRTQHLPVLYQALAEYEMAHLIVSRDEASLKALEQIVFGLRETSDAKLIHDCEPPKNMHEALLCSSYVRRSCADRLYLLRGISRAKQLWKARINRENNRKASLARAQRVLAKTQNQPPTQG